MQRTSINPWPWSTRLGFDQGQLIDGHRRQLLCSGQDAVDADGAPLHPADMAAQLELAAEMTLVNVVRLDVFTTDVDELFRHWATIPDRFGDSHGTVVTSIVGVSRLAARELMVLFEATAID